MGFEIDGLDELQDQLEDLQKNAEQLDGENEVPFDELFPEEFMRKYTDAETIEGFFDESSWNIESEEDFEQIPDQELDQYVDDHSRFRTWEQMQGEAATEWMKRQMGF